jgi:transposase-like protein
MSENKGFDKDELLRKMFKLMLESLMDGERTAVLGYGKHEFSGYGENGAGNGNSRNGYYERDLLTGLGLLEKLNIPRDRLGEFTPDLLDKWQRATKPMDELVLSLYAKGMTTRDINDVVEKIYGKSYSPQQVTLITKEIEQERLAWEKRPLQKRYIAIFVDCLFVSMRRGDTVAKDAVYVVCGIDSEGHRDLLGFYIGTSESATFWKEVLADLRDRGVEQVLLFVFDGVTGLETVVKQIFPKALTQLCIVHAVRNSLTSVRPDDKKEVAGKLKYVYTAKSLAEAKERLLAIQIELKTKYPRLLNRWFDKLPQLMQFLEFPEYVQKHVYSTNWIERLNKDFRKVLKNKNSLPTEDAVRNLLYLRVRDITRRYEAQRVNGFVAYQVDLAVMWQKHYGDSGKETGEFTQST